MDKIIKKINNYKFKFVNNTLKFKIIKLIDNLFFNLNKEEKNILITFSTYLVEDIANKFFNYNSTNINEYYEKLFQNKNRDLIMIIFLLLPIPKDYKLFSEINSLNKILLNSDENVLYKKDVENKEWDEIKHKFNISLYSIDLIQSKPRVYNLKGTRLIYKIIETNFFSILETLKIVNGKLYINWINTLPLGYNNYKKSKIFRETDLFFKNDKFKNIIQNINKLSFPKDYTNIMNKYNGLYIGDIYQIFRIKYYEDVKNIKWLFFNTKVRNERIYFIQYLNNLFDLNKTILKFEDYEDLSIKDQSEFENRFDKIKNYLEYKKNAYLDHNVEVDIFKILLIYLINNYSKRYLLQNESLLKFRLNLKNEKEDEGIEEYEKTKNNITIDDLLKGLNNLPTNHLWNYIQECIIELKSSVYGNYIIQDNEILSQEKFFYLKDTTLNLKNIYNISKLLSHYSENGEWNLLDKFYDSINKTRVFNFWNKLLGNINYSEWLNLRKNISLQENQDFISDTEYFSIITKISSDWEKIWLDLIWKYLIENGLLSEYKINNNLTVDYQNEEIKRLKLKNYIEKNIMKNKDYLDCYYYLNNKKYKNQNKIRLNDFKINYKEYSFLEVLTKLNWYSLYSLDWINQIKFFNNFRNCQVLYVTGSTGTGKSTQVPKLLLYSLKMINYKSDGKIICTEPRISPTEENAKRIALELGLPIVQPTKTVGQTNINTNNYNVEIKHKKSRHDLINSQLLSLKITTDGTLLEELKNNIYLKKKIIRSGKDFDFIYSTKNLYDIVIVDEAHEHNTNMDLILTLMRNTCMFNNSVKLVIISATLEEDEFAYRNYFRSINDNIQFPIKHPLFYNYFNPSEENYFIESTLIDRKISIIPYGKNTLYKIKDIYLEEDIDQSEVEKYILSTLKEITQISTAGHILIFCDGENQIRKLIKKINLITDKDTIAIPFFSRLNSYYKNIAINIKENIKDITNSKANINSEWGEDKVDPIDGVPKNTYKRAIILSTNIAEASVTIDGLVFVIDSGYEKILQYFKNIELSKLVIKKISESSRIQRRGRVGRVSDGYVYYLYKKHGRENEKTNYKIVNENFMNNYVNLLENIGNTTKKYIITQNNEILGSQSLFPISSLNPYSVDFKFNDNTDFIKIFNLYYDLNINEIIKSQFLINGEQFDRKTYFNKYDNKSLKYLNTNQTGFKNETLIDTNGTFYLIHFEESSIKRNLNYKIIKVLTEVGYVFNKKVNLNLINHITEKSTKSLLTVSDKNYTSKTNLVDIQTKLQSKIGLDQNLINVNDILTIFYSYGLDINTEVIEILAFLKTFNYDFTFLKNYQNFKDADLNVIYNITQKIRLLISNSQIFDMLKENSIIIKNLKQTYDKRIQLFKKYEFTIDPIAELIDDWYILNWNKNNKILNNKKGFLNWLSNYNLNKQLKKKILKKININKLSINLKISKKIINTYIDLLLNILIGISTLEKNDDKYFKEDNILENLKNDKKFKKLKSNTKKDIINVFFLANPDKILLRYNFNSNYQRIRPYLYDIDNKNYFENILINNPLNINEVPILFYLKADIDDTSSSSYKIYCINKIDIQDLINFFPLIYNPINFSTSIPIFDSYTRVMDIITREGSLYENFIYQLKNNWTIFNFPLFSNKFINISRYVNNMLKENKN